MTGSWIIGTGRKAGTDLFPAGFQYLQVLQTKERKDIFSKASLPQSVSWRSLSKQYRRSVKAKQRQKIRSLATGGRFLPWRQIKVSKAP